MKEGSFKTSSTNIIISDYPDPDVIRVDDTYYMVSTTMHFMPGCVILRSYNLLDWEFCSYVYDELDPTPGQQLKDNKGVYGKGMWAASLRYHNGLFYVSFVANDTHKTYLYTSESITGPWKKSEIPGFYHDMSILFDDDGKTYIVSGNTDIYLTEMENDLSGPKKNGINKIIIQDNKETANLGYEGSHIYKINNKYYVFLIHGPKNMMRTEACYVADNIAGPYKGGDVLHSDLGNWNSGVAQGGIVQTNDGKWFGILFQDHGALGRIPVLVPVNFEKDFPVFGENGLVPSELTVLDNKPGHKYQPLYTSDFCDNKGNINPQWQWNHIPDKNLVSVSKDSVYIKTDKTVINPVQASNILTQRTYTENCAGSITLDASNINAGDYAGLIALEGEYAFIAVTKKQGKYYLTTADHKTPHTPWTMNVFDTYEPTFRNEIELSSPVVTLQLKFSLLHNKEKVHLMYFDPEKNDFVCLGTPSPLRYTLDQFVGVRIGLMVYSTKETGGSALFRDFNYKLL